MECQDDGSNDDDRNAAEAGMVRGFLRSIARFPAIGRLPASPKVPQAIARTMRSKPMPTIVPTSVHFPKRLPTALKTSMKPASGHVRVGRGILRRRVPVKDVARISDRVSQGLEVYEIATQHDSQWKLSRVASFVTGK